MKRPTAGQVVDARLLLEDAEFLDVDNAVIDAIRTLVAATEPPTDEEIAMASALESRRLSPSRGDNSASHASRVLAAVKDGSSFTTTLTFAIVRHFFGPVKP